jgi:hypothetical protein
VTGLRSSHAGGPVKNGNGRTAAAKVQVARTDPTAGELADLLSQRLGPDFQVAADGQEVLARRSLLAAIVQIAGVPRATVFRVRSVGVPVVSANTTRIVATALRKSPEFGPV